MLAHRGAGRRRQSIVIEEVVGKPGEESLRLETNRDHSGMEEEGPGSGPATSCFSSSRITWTMREAAV